jgi:hypothetical protein
MGTLAGAGLFRCESCGFGVALHEMDQVPACPHCGGEEFKRGSIFEDRSPDPPPSMPAGDSAEWLDEARDALVEPGHYLAYSDGDRVRISALQNGWTRLGRSLSAHIRLDDPTVSRRHALVHCEDDAARILDDRSLNGVFLNGDRIDWHAIEDGDRVTIGRFDLHYIFLTGPTGERSGRAVRSRVA